jgi:hypothetical protein
VKTEPGGLAVGHPNLDNHTWLFWTGAVTPLNWRNSYRQSRRINLLGFYQSEAPSQTVPMRESKRKPTRIP